MKRTARLEMEGFLGVKQGEIHMGGSTIPGEYILPKVIGDFKEKHPAISVDLTIADTSEIETRVLEGTLELGVVGSKGSHKDLIYQGLWEDELVLAIPAQHRWARKKAVSFSDLLDEPFIVREMGSGTLKSMEASLRDPHSKAASSLQVVARFGSSTAVKEGIKAGLGVSILSSRAIDTELKTGILRALRVKGLPMHRRFYLVRDRRRIASPLCQAMIDFLLATSESK